MLLLSLCFISVGVYGQKITHTSHPVDTVAAIRPGKPVPPAWAAAHQYDMRSHVYFPDYYAYYDPTRGGYMFWNNGKWVFTPTVPPYLEHIDLSQSRVQILKGLSLDLHPEESYPHHMKLYPAQDVNNPDVPVPVSGAPSH